MHSQYTRGPQRFSALAHALGTSPSEFALSRTNSGEPTQPDGSGALGKAILVGRERSERSRRQVPLASDARSAVSRCAESLCDRSDALCARVYCGRFRSTEARRGLCDPSGRAQRLAGRGTSSDDCDERVRPRHRAIAIRPAARAAEGPTPPVTARSCREPLSDAAVIGVRRCRGRGVVGTPTVALDAPRPSSPLFARAIRNTPWRRPRCLSARSSPTSS